MRKNLVKRLQARDFSLKHTLECGQFFRFRQVEDWYYVNSRDKFFKVRQKAEVLEFQGVAEDYLRGFFSLDASLEKILSEIMRDRHIKEAVQLCRGLRLIRQDPWECLISYICSITANIPQIRHCLERIARQYGRKVVLDGIESYTFPAPGEIKGLSRLEKAGVGFRARYILETSRRTDDECLESLRGLSYDMAKGELMRLPGVGDKVADCVLLFSLGFLEAFPIDRWIKRQMQGLYFGGKKVSNKHIHTFAHGYFGQYAGYAQEYLYCLVRAKQLHS